MNWLKRMWQHFLAWVQIRWEQVQELQTARQKRAAAKAASAPPDEDFAEDSRKPEDMPREVGNLITLAAFLVPALAFGILGLVLGNINTAAGLAILWLGMLSAVAVKVLRKTTFTVVERFGLFWQVKFAGVRIIIPWIDTIIMEGDFLQKSVTLFANEKGELASIDFKDGSAPIKAVAWYQIGDPQSTSEDDRTEQVLDYTYRLKEVERESRVAKIFQGEFRSLLEQGLEITEAQKRAEDLAEEAVGKAKPALQQIGIFPFPGKGIIVEDIVLPADIISMRQQKQKGEADAQEAIKRAQSYLTPVLAMKAAMQAGIPSPDGTGHGQMTISDEKLVELFLTQKGLETLKDTKSNITLVSPDLKGALTTIMIGSQKPGGTP